MEGMRRNIVEGDDYSVLPVPVVRLAKWVRDRFRRARPSEEAEPADDDVER